MYWLKKCQKCGWETDTDLVFCQHCGTRLEDESCVHTAEEQLREELKRKEEKIVDLTAQLEQKEALARSKRQSGKKWGIVSVVLLFVCVALIGFSMFQSSKASFYDRACQSAEERCRRLVDQVEVLSEKSQFMDQYIGLINMNSEDDFYHTYDCETWDWSSGGWSFLAYNTKAAEKQGYISCPLCHE